MRLRTRTNEVYAGLARRVGEMPDGCEFTTLDVWSGSNQEAKFQLRAAKRAGRLLGQDFEVDTTAILMPANDGEHEIKTMMHVARSRTPLPADQLG